MSLLFNLLENPQLSPAFRRVFSDPNPPAPRRAPRNLQQLIAADADVDSEFMAEICRVGSERWMEVREQEGADHAADVRRERDEAGE